MWQTHRAVRSDDEAHGAVTKLQARGGSRRLCPGQLHVAPAAGFPSCLRLGLAGLRGRPAGRGGPAGPGRACQPGSSSPPSTMSVWHQCPPPGPQTPVGPPCPAGHQVPARMQTDRQIQIMAFICTGSLSLTRLRVMHRVFLKLLK